MNRIKYFLAPNETVIKSVKPDIICLCVKEKLFLLSIFFNILYYLISISFNISLLYIQIMIISLGIPFLKVLLTWTFTTYYITNNQIILETGILGRDYNIIKIDNIVEVILDISIFDVILNTGKIKLSTANDTQLCLISNIRNPKKIMKYISNKQ